MAHDYQGPMIRVVDLVTHYGERLVLNHVNLEVEVELPRQNLILG